MELELEAGDDTEVAATTTQSPEQVIIFRCAGVHLTAIRRNDFRREQVVDGHTVLSAKPAGTAAKRQTSHTRGRVDTQRCGETVHLCGRVEVGKGTAGLDGRPAGLRVHLDALHQRKIDHEAVVTDGIARDVVSTPSNRDKEVVLAREPDGLDNIFRRRAAGDQPRPAVDHGVPNLAYLVIARVARKNHTPPEVRFELVDI